MLSHVCLGIADYDRAFTFYDELAEELGWQLKFAEAAKSWAGWTARGGQRPLFVITRPFDGGPATPGNGPMVALLARSREAVRLVYARAIEAGGSCEGPPGLRPQYHLDFYGAYFRDLDGNKLCVCCHDAVGEPEL